MIKLIIWDFDGVLVNSVPKNQLTFKKMFEKYGKKYKREDLVHTTLQHVVNVFNNAIPVNIQKDFEEFKEELKTFTECEISKEDLIEDAIDLLRFAKNNGVINVIATSSTKDRLEKLLKDCNIDGFFDCAFADSDVIKPKPDPEVIFKILKTFKIAPENTVFIEDSKKNIYAGIKAGTKTILFTKDNYKDNNIDLIVDSLKKINLKDI